MMKRVNGVFLLFCATVACRVDEANRHWHGKTSWLMGKGSDFKGNQSTHPDQSPTGE
jgi:hypothetical protein